MMFPQTNIYVLQDNICVISSTVTPKSKNLAILSHLINRERVSLQLMTQRTMFIDASIRHARNVHV